MLKKTAKTNTCSEHVKQAGKMNNTKKIKNRQKSEKAKNIRQKVQMQKCLCFNVKT